MVTSQKTTHIPPRYEARRATNSYVRVTYCPRCNTIGQYEDMHPACPCPRCGSKVAEGNFSGKWQRTNTGLLEWFKEEVGVWRVTSVTKEILIALYKAHRHADVQQIKKMASAPTTVEPPAIDIYDLDFTKTFGGKK